MKLLALHAVRSRHRTLMQADDLALHPAAGLIILSYTAATKHISQLAWHHYIIAAGMT